MKKALLRLLAAVVGVALVIWFVLDHRQKQLVEGQALVTMLRIGTTHQLPESGESTRLMVNSIDHDGTIHVQFSDPELKPYATDFAQ